MACIGRRAHGHALHLNLLCVRRESQLNFPAAPRYAPQLLRICGNSGVRWNAVLPLRGAP